MRIINPSDAVLRVLEMTDTVEYLLDRGTTSRVAFRVTGCGDWTTYATW